MEVKMCTVAGAVTTGLTKEVPMTNSIFDIKTHIQSNLRTLNIINEVQPDLIHCN